MKYWLLATYKINELKRVQTNLFNQKFCYYLPKLTFKDTESYIKSEVMFPGYIFVETSLSKYSSLKYTKGIKGIVNFGNNIPYISNCEINKMKEIEDSSKLNPKSLNFKIGQEAYISEGSFKGMIGKIASLTHKKRVDVFLFFLGTVRKINIEEKVLNS